MKLPEAYCRRMQELLGDEYPAFMASYHKTRWQGLRVNTLKITVDEFIKIAPFPLTPIPWVSNGFYIDEKERPAKHPYYHAGLYYIQEPSAMAPVQVLDVKPGERVLDLCAAPGGKSTQIAAGLQGEGMLVSNDLSESRAKALVKNIELFGARNVIVTNESPDRLAARFPGYFHKILIDAPCSGEGMFRKDPDAVRQWRVYSSAKCVLMQGDILESAEKMLVPGGSMVYSTCTFNPEENEKTIDLFLKNHPDFVLDDIPLKEGWAEGRSEWAGGNQELKKTIRLWPHKLKGEGHFLALLKRKGMLDLSLLHSETPASLQKDLPEFIDFVQDNLTIRFNDGNFVLYGDRLFLQPAGAPDLKGLKVMRPGLFLGTMKKKRFEPSSSLALALKKESFIRTRDFAPDSREIFNYLKGETINITGEKGWTGICVNGFPVGWGKQLDGILKNHYPKGWRIL
jgi:NOL1/NOP2/sun family putative RNA methylase